MDRSLAMSESGGTSVPVPADALDFQLDVDGTIIKIGSTVQRFGYRPQDLVGHSVTSFIHPDDRAGVLHRLTTRYHGLSQPTEFSIRIVTPDGTPHECRVQAMAMLVDGKDSNKPKLVGIEGIAWEHHASSGETELLATWLRLDATAMAMSENGVLVTVSPSLATLLGCTPEQLVGIPLSRFLSNASDDMALQKLIHSGVITVGPLEVIVGVDDCKPMLVKATATREVGSKASRQYWVFQAVLDQDRVQAAVAEVDQRFREMIELAGESILLIEDFIFSDCNRQTEVMFGRPREEMIGIHPGDPRISPKIQPNGKPSAVLAEQVIAAANEGRPQRFVWQHLREDGTPFLAEISLTRLSGDKSRLLCVQWDITDRVEHQERLEASEERFRRIFENAEIGIVLFDNEGNFLKVNPYFCQLLGYSEPELRVMNMAVVCFPGDDRSEELRLQDELLRGHRSSYKLRKRFRRRDGSEAVADVIVNQIITSDGVVNQIGLFQDQTAQLQVEKEREQLHEQLVQAQKMEEIGRITGGIAHDFNNVLTALQGNTDIADMALQQDEPPLDALRGFVAEMKKTVQRAAGLTRQLLAFSRTQVTNPRHMNVDNLIEDLTHMLSRVAPATVDIQHEYGSGQDTVFIDPTHFTQVILNLTTNAVDAMPDGGQLMIRTELQIVDSNELSVDADGDGGTDRTIQVTVEDSGIGMPSEVMHQIFNPFYTTKESDKGTGLGLSTCKTLIENAGGSIRVESEYGVGTRFVIDLPSSGTLAEEEQDEMLSVKGGAESVLVVEDEDIIRRIVDRMLRMAGYETTVFMSAEEALKHVMDSGAWPDLLLTDIVLPNQSGTELLIALREHHPELKVICMSGYTRDSKSLKTVMDEKLPFLPKPFKREQLLSLVRSVLDGKHQPVGD